MKNRLILGCLASLLLTTRAFAGATNVNAYAWAQIDSSASAYQDILETNAAYIIKVKARSDVNASTASKAYIAFDLNGKSPNTTVNATLTLKRSSGSGVQHVYFWALKQAFAGMGTNLCWGSDTSLIPVGVVGAQGNDTNNNDMLATGGAYLTDKTTSGSGTDTITLTAPWSQYVFGGKIIFAITGNYDTNTYTTSQLDSSAGYRLTNSASVLPVFNFTDTIGNQPPSITSTTNVTLYSHTTSAAIPFTVADDSTPAANINLVATSSDTTVVTNFAYTGQGVSGSRTLQFYANDAGTATITVKVDDGTATNFTQFTVTVLANPTIIVPAWTNTIGTNPVTSTFTVGDALFPVTTITNAGTSLNLTLVSSTNILFAGTTSNRTVTVTAKPDQDGVAVIKLTAGDANGTTSDNYPVMVRPSTNIYLVDHFKYDDGTLDSHSAFFWRERTAGSVGLRVRTNQAVIRPSSSGQSLIAPLAGAPYNHGLIWVGFTALWTNVPTAANGWFLHLHDSTGTNNLGRIYAMTNSATNGTFTIGIQADGSKASAAALTNELTTNVTYKIVMAYDIDGNGGLFPPLAGSAYAAQLWINPTDTNSPSALDVNTTAAYLGVPFDYIGLRQNTGMGDILIDDLRVGASFADVLPPTIVLPTRPVVTSWSLASTNLTINFTGDTNDLATAFTVMRSSIVNGSYTTPVTNAAIYTITSGNFSAVVPISGNANFYRIYR